MGARRVVDWRITQDDDGNYELHLGNRQVLRDTTMTEINKHLRKNRQAGQTVHEVAEDGYITDVTRRVERRQSADRRDPAQRPRKPLRMPLIRW